MIEMNYLLQDSYSYLKASNQNKYLAHAIKCMDFFSNLNFTFLLKDCRGQILYMTNFAAKIYGVIHNLNKTESSYHDTFLEKHPTLSRQFAELDSYLCNSHASTSRAITFYDYADGIPARLTIRHKIIGFNQTTIGILHQEIPIDLHNPGTTIINSIINDELGIEINRQPPNILANKSHEAIAKLSEYEYKICFLLSIGWSLPKINNFLTRLGFKQQSSLDALIKKKNIICNKLEIVPAEVSKLQEALINMQMYRNIPSQFLDHLHGTYLVS